MPTILKVQTTDNGDIEITTTANVKTSSYIDNFIKDFGEGADGCIDMTPLGDHGLTESQWRRFIAVWEHFTTSGVSLLDKETFQHRNFRLNDCLDDTAKAVIKAANDAERAEVKHDLVRATCIPFDELETNETTKQFLENGFIGLKHIIELLKYSDFIDIPVCRQFYSFVGAGILKSLSKVLPMPESTSIEKS